MYLQNRKRGFTNSSAHGCIQKQLVLAVIHQETVGKMLCLNTLYSWSELPPWDTIKTSKVAALTALSKLSTEDEWLVKQVADGVTLSHQALTEVIALITAMNICMKKTLHSTFDSINLQSVKSRREAVFGR